MDEETRVALMYDLAVPLVAVELIESSPDVPDELRHFAGIAVRRLIMTAQRLQGLQAVNHVLFQHHDDSAERSAVEKPH